MISKSKSAIWSILSSEKWHCVFQRDLTANSYVFYEVANSDKFVRSCMICLNPSNR